MSLTVYNSLSKKKEKFETIEKNKVRMYCCGPTVYDYLHIGNFRGAVFYNFLCNHLTSLGYDVTYVYNFTDVDDKILNRAKEEKTTAKAIAQKYIDEFWVDFNALKLTPHTHNPKVTESMDAIISLVERLITNEKAYVVDGEVFYSVRDFYDYGCLSNRNLDDQQEGSRIDVDGRKKDPADFVLWKPAKDTEESWDSPWGKGRPGWHIECSAMIQKLLGEEIDIHGGGIDLLFPHHENELAQGEGATGKKYVRYWVHNNMFNFDGQKMSKSLGNIRTMRSFLKEYDGEIFKYMVLSHHYRSICDVSDHLIQQSITALARVYSALSIAHSYDDGNLDEAQLQDKKLSPIIKESEVKIAAAFADDFNTPLAFGALFEVVRAFNNQVQRGGPISDAVKVKSALFKKFFHRYGSQLALFTEPADEYLKKLDNMLLNKMNLAREDVDSLVQERRLARENKDFTQSDLLRDKLAEMGIKIQDGKDKTYWEVAK